MARPSVTEMRTTPSSPEPSTTMFDSCGRPSAFSVVSTPCLRSATNARAVSRSMTGRTGPAGDHSCDSRAPAVEQRPCRHRRAPTGGLRLTGTGEQSRRGTRRRRHRRHRSCRRPASTAATGTSSSRPVGPPQHDGRGPSLTTSSGGRCSPSRAASATVASTTSGRNRSSRPANRLGAERLDDRLRRHVDAETGAVRARPGATKSTVLAPIGSAHSEYAGTCSQVTPSAHAGSTAPSCSGRPAVGEHRPLAAGLDEHDDCAGRAAALHADVDARAARARRRGARRRRRRRRGPTNRSRQPAIAAAAATLAALPPRERVITAGVSVPRAGAAVEAYDDVLDEVADDAQHGHLVSRPPGASMEG